MVNENIVNPSENTPEVNRDLELNITSLLKSSREEPIKEKTPLERMKEEKEKNGSGLVVDTAELVNEDDKKIKASKMEDDAINEIKDYMSEQDKLINAAQTVEFKNAPKNAIDMVRAMNELEDIANNESSNDSEMLQPKNTENSSETNTSAVIGNKVNESETTSDTTDISDEKRNIVNILIDKTGLGGEFKFTEEEHEKIVNATQIRLTEVEEIDLATITVKKPEKSFLEEVDEYQLSSSRVPVVFPVSRFKASMTGLSYGEMGDISLDNENITAEQIRKKLTVIYNKMANPSIGKFKSFEEFLHNFSYADIDLAVYGLVVATFPEISEIQMSCNNPKCKQSYNHKFSPRTLIKFEKCDERFLTAIKDVVECGIKDVNKLAESSPVKTYKRIKLPYSGFIVEIGFASAYEYLYTIIDNVIGDTFKDNHPDDVNGILQLNTTLLSLVRSVYIPDKKGSYVKYDEFEDMINALYMIKPEEISTLASILQQYTDSYRTVFELTDIVCPHCGSKTESLPIDINYLVFLRYQRLMSTEIKVKNVTVL